MAPSRSEPTAQQRRPTHHHHHHHINSFVKSATTNLLSFFHPQTPPFLPSPSASPPSPSSNSKSIYIPIPMPLQLTESATRSTFDSSTRPGSYPTLNSDVSPATVRIAGLNLEAEDGGGPAFVGQIYSMWDLSRTGIMAVSTHFDIPFIKRTPEWFKKVFATITKSEKDPVFRFFMDLGDAVSYVKQLNIPSGGVGGCCLDLAYKHFKEKPHMFQFVPNEKQVKVANELLRTIPQNGGKKRVDGVPVFSAENLDIAVATMNGIKWYTPYFFDKKMLDNILEESVDQHFQGLINTRHMQRLGIDDNLTAGMSDMIQEFGEDSLWEPPEVQESMDEVGHPSIPLSVIAKAAEIQLQYAADRVLLGNRWLRKAIGIQPKFPYLVNSFEKRITAAFLKASKSRSTVETNSSGSELMLEDNSPVMSTKRLDGIESVIHNSRPDPFLPKVTMVISPSQLTKTNVKTIMESTTRNLEQMGPGNEERYPLFVADVGDYYSRSAKTGSTRWVRGAN